MVAAMELQSKERKTIERTSRRGNPNSGNEMPLTRDESGTWTEGCDTSTFVHTYSAPKVGICTYSQNKIRKNNGD